MHLFLKIGNTSLSNVTLAVFVVSTGGLAGSGAGSGVTLAIGSVLGSDLLAASGFSFGSLLFGSLLAFSFEAFSFLLLSTAASVLVSLLGSTLTTTASF